MQHKLKYAIGIALVLGFLLAGNALGQVSAGFDARWSRFASGGGERQSANYLVQDILGQWVSQSPVSANARIITDFYSAGDTAGAQLFIPILRR
jgi:hypothetical protein